MTERRFAFGRNWQAYSENALSPEKLELSRQAFQDLMKGLTLQGKSFLDIGFGQGLALFLAQESGAQACGLDIDPDNLTALAHTARLFEEQETPRTYIGSILDRDFINTLHRQEGPFDIVHSWGVLHHTGQMERAILSSVELVDEGGHLFLAIYNAHWSSPYWYWVKKGYNLAPTPMQKVLVYAFYPIIYLAKWWILRKNPLKTTRRGMDFLYNLIDWIGGFPYEYASIDTIKTLVCQQGFSCLRVIPAHVPTGCNQFIFQKNRCRSDAG